MNDWRLKHGDAMAQLGKDLVAAYEEIHSLQEQLRQVDDWRVKATYVAQLDKALEAAANTICSLRNQLEEQKDFATDAVAEVTYNWGETQDELESQRQTIVRLQAEIAKLNERIRELETKG